MGFSSQKPERRAIERNESAVQALKRKTWPASKKCGAERRLIVFIDKSGLSQRPTRARTWAPKGQTPIVQFHFNWKHTLAIAGLTRSNFLFRLVDGAIKSAQIVEFLKALSAQLKRKLLIVWDGAAQHKSRIVRAYLDGTHGAIQMAPLPAYAPDLNPVEYLLGLAQAPRAGELLPALPGRTKINCAQQITQRREPSIDHHSLLETGRIVVMS